MVQHSLRHDNWHMWQGATFAGSPQATIWYTVTACILASRIARNMHRGAIWGDAPRGHVFLAQVWGARVRISRGPRVQSLAWDLRGCTPSCFGPGQWTTGPWGARITHGALELISWFRHECQEYQVSPELATLYFPISGTFPACPK